MKYHIIAVLLSFLLFVFRTYIPVEVIFLISGLYYINTLFLLKYYKSDKWLIPPQLFTLLMFIYIFIPSIFIYYGGMIYERFSSSLFNELNIISANLVTLFATSTMWISFISVNRNTRFENINKSSTLSKQSVYVRNKLFVIFLILVALQLYGVITNVTGYSVESSTKSQIFSLFGRFSTLILIYYFFSNYESIFKKLDVKFLLMILSLVIIGFGHASKTKVVTPFLFLLLVDYFKRKTFNKKIIVSGFLIFLLSFIIVPILRDSINKQEELELDLKSIDNKNVTDAFMSLLYRTTYVPQLVLAIDYSGELPESVNNLWEYHVLSPIYSVTPRSLYKNKPEITFGKWFSFNVYGSTRENNIGATYQGILYLNGGLGSVFIGFILLGLFQALFVRLFFNSRYIAIYLTLLLTLFMLPQEPWVFYVRLIQSAILLVLFYKFVIR